MFIFPFRFHRTKRKTAYRKQTKKTVEITGAVCRVIVRVTFPEQWVPEITGGDNSVRVDYKFKECDQYGFMVEIQLDKNEYLGHKHDLEAFACEKARNDPTYKAILSECIRQCGNDREYKVEEFLPMHDYGAVEVKYVSNEWEEYVPIR